ncbi:MAG: acyl-CoA thioesterase II [Acidimicrobiales bacterium]|nr:MAG: acyl-CoA thioesterase II [Acidimicrobiales bacterium]
MLAVNFAEMMQLEHHGPDTYVGTGPDYPWGGLYGGQIVAQALKAAGNTVEPEYIVHSLHAYFIRLGDSSEPIRFEVDRVRNGRAFVTRSVVARQSGGAILVLAASFQVPEPGPDEQTAHMPKVPFPDELPESSWSPVFRRRMVPVEEPGRAVGWLRNSEPIGDDPLMHACALAYQSDDLPTDAVVTQHPLWREGSGEDRPVWTASLDHAIWFHRAIRADEWLLQEFVGHGLLSSRGTAVGYVFTADGEHVATVAQEVLVRPRRM